MTEEMTFDQGLFYPCMDWWNNPDSKEKRRRYAKETFPGREDGRSEGPARKVAGRRAHGADQVANDDQAATKFSETEVDRWEP